MIELKKHNLFFKKHNGLFKKKSVRKEKNKDGSGF